MTGPGLWDRLADDLEAVNVETVRPWADRARPEQIPPPGTWRWWLALAGRGWGKTESGAQWCAGKARAYPGARVGLVAATFADGRDTMVEGESGLLTTLDPWELRGGSVDTAWNRSMGELFLANGSRFKVFSSEKPRSLRGPQFHFVWGDEPAYWLDAAAGVAKDSTFSNLNFALRLPARRGWDDEFRAQGVLTTTPRRVALIRVPASVIAEHPERAGLMQRGDTHVVRGKTSENVHNLSREYYEAVIAPLIGTTLGRQELDAQILEDVEGALWRQTQIDDDRIAPGLVPVCKRVVSFDPSGGAGKGHDEHGIIVVGGRGSRPAVDLYVLADLSLNGTPTQAARAALLASVEWAAATVVFEKNQGQDWIPTVLEQTWEQLLTEGLVSGPPPAFREVSSTRSKRLRAEPVQGMYEQHRVHHAGTFVELEEQQTTWVPDEGDSPDRLDALVHGATWLYGHSGSSSMASPAASLAGLRVPAIPMTLPR